MSGVICRSKKWTRARKDDRSEQGQRRTDVDQNFDSSLKELRDIEMRALQHVAMLIECDSDAVAAGRVVPDGLVDTEELADVRLVEVGRDA